MRGRKKGPLYQVSADSPTVILVFYELYCIFLTIAFTKTPIIFRFQFHYIRDIGVFTHKYAQFDRLQRPHENQPNTGSFGC